MVSSIHIYICMLQKKILLPVLVAVKLQAVAGRIIWLMNRFCVQSCDWLRVESAGVYIVVRRTAGKFRQYVIFCAAEIPLLSDMYICVCVA